MQVPDDAVTITDNTVTISLKNALVVDQFRIPGGAGNNLGIAGVPATISFDITYSKSGPAHRVAPSTRDPLSPYNWEGKMWDATNSGTFSVAYSDGSFSAQGSFDSAGNFGEMGFERNGVFVEGRSGKAGLAAQVLGAAKLPANPAPPYAAQNHPNVVVAQDARSAHEAPNEPKLKGKIPIRELIH